MLFTDLTHTQRGGDYTRLSIIEGRSRILAITDDFTQQKIHEHNLQKLKVH